jgi:Sec-independent protein translocase protein TatA
VDKFLNSEVLITEKLDTYRFQFEKINDEIVFFKKDNTKIGIVERNVEMINKAFTKLTTLEARITEWSGPSEDEIPASVEIKVSPDGSMAARLKTVKDMPQIMRTYVKNITRLRTKIAERKEEEEEEDDDEDDDEDNDNDQGLGNYEGSSDKPDSNVEDGEDNEDGTIKRNWGVSKEYLVPYLVKAIQELNAKITALENK